jgi:hypothetical protein
VLVSFNFPARAKNFPAPTKKFSPLCTAAKLQLNDVVKGI